jgi:hypothetical protein
MHRLFAGLLALSIFWTAPVVQARDTEYKLNINEVLHSPEFKDKLGDNVTFYFGDQRTPRVVKTFGEFVSNRKTNSFGRPDEQACRWAMLSALLALRERAEQMGGNAVTNIVSYYKKDTASSETEYECHAGAFVAGVALKGTVVKLVK